MSFTHNHFQLLLLSILFKTIFSNTLIAQGGGTFSTQKDNYILKLKQGEKILPKNFDVFSFNNPEVQQTRHQGYYYLIMQTYELPSGQLRSMYEQMGIQFLNYIPNNAYLTAIPIQFDKYELYDLNIRSLVPFNSDYKMSVPLQNGEIPHHAIAAGSSNILIDLFFFPDANIEEIRQDLSNNFNTEFLESSLVELNRLTLEISLRQLNQLA